MENKKDNKKEIEIQKEKPKALRDENKKNAEKSEAKEETKKHEKEQKAKIPKSLKKEDKEKLNDYEKNLKEKKEKYNNYEKIEKNYKKRIAIISLVIILILSILTLSTIFAILNINNKNIISGVSIEGIQISGLSKEEASKRISNAYEEKLTTDLVLKYNEYEANINPELLEGKYKISEAIEEAFYTGRSGNIFQNNFEIIKTMLNQKDIKVELTLNEEVIQNQIADISSKLPGTVVESTYYVEGNKLIITRGKEGVVANKEELTNLIYKRLEDITTKNDEYIQIPTLTEGPKEIDLEKIHEEIYKEPKDAYMTQNPIAVYAEVEGVDFDVDKVKEMLKEEKDEYEIELTITKPKITLKELGKEAFPEPLATYSTKYDASNINRSTNLEIACSKIDGTVLMPGEEFSYNKTLGERTIEAGYKEAHVYSGGKVIDGLGGGICQISSTLYNSVLLANLEITERWNHQFSATYVPDGRDATVVYGVKDFKFKNSRTYPIKLEASAKNGIAKISIYGIKEKTEYEVSIQTRVISVKPYTIKYIDDATLTAGTEKIEQYGLKGAQTETYKVLSKNGKVVSKTLLSKDSYNALQRIIRRGTKQ